LTFLLDSGFDLWQDYSFQMFLHAVGLILQNGLDSFFDKCFDQNRQLFIDLSNNRILNLFLEF